MGESICRQGQSEIETERVQHPAPCDSLCHYPKLLNLSVTVQPNPVPSLHLATERIVINTFLYSAQLCKSLQRSCSGEEEKETAKGNESEIRNRKERGRGFTDRLSDCTELVTVIFLKMVHSSCCNSHSTSGLCLLLVQTSLLPYLALNE